MTDIEKSFTDKAEPTTPMSKESSQAAGSAPTLRTLFSTRAIEPASDIDAFIPLAAAAQGYRYSLDDPDKRASVPQLTRTTSLYVAGTLDKAIAKTLEAAGLQWQQFALAFGFPDPLVPESVDDVPLDRALFRALDAYADSKALVTADGTFRPFTLPDLALAIFRSATDETVGLLPGRLQELGVDISAAEAYLSQLVEQRASGEKPSEQPAEELAEGTPLDGKTTPDRAEERVPEHLDDPALEDRLNREPFAEVLAIRMAAVRRKLVEERQGRESGAFSVHLHGPWGSGKTSVLNFLATMLKHGEYGEKAHESPKWIVVEFNAWQNKRFRPPWWQLVVQLKRECLRQSRRSGYFSNWLALNFHWLVWALRARLFPVAIAFLLIVAVAFVVLTSTDEVPRTIPWGELATALGIFGAVFTAGALLVGRLKSWLVGSASASEWYARISQDPSRPVARLFERLVTATGKPVAIFIDDLDRCDHEYVVELLEGIQTLFRNANVCYVIAADRDWIRASFETSYANFVTTIGEPGRPLGYLFLEKMFQVSASIPQLQAETKAEYWRQLIYRKRKKEPRRPPQETKRLAEQRLGDSQAPDQIQAVIDHAATEFADDVEMLQSIRAAAAKRVSSEASQERQEHFLAQFESLLEPNPRAMKRLVNAYGIRQASNFLAGRRVNPSLLALWTIMEMRWPRLADYLVDATWQHPDKPLDAYAPDDLKTLLSTDAVNRVMHFRDEELAISKPNIRKIFGFEECSEGER